jgi:hypothetical protein
MLDSFTRQGWCADDRIFNVSVAHSTKSAVKAALEVNGIGMDSS